MIKSLMPISLRAEFIVRIIVMSANKFFEPTISISH